MVSFSCENCGDVLTKKKLDPHRNKCRGATFTCIDCMVHFQGTSYRAHTSCMTEAQKYEGALYRDKKAKPQKQNSQSQALVPRQPYVEDEQDTRVAIVDAPPHAPSPPPAPNVFDFLVGNATPNEPKVADESRMIEGTPLHSKHSGEPARTNGRHVEPYDSQEHFATNGYSYGHTPVEPSFQRYDSYTQLTEQSEMFYTPAPKTARAPKEPDTTASKKTDKKRKRGHVEDLDMNLVHAQQERDAEMTDAPPVLHSGLTGGLNKLLNRPEFPPSPDYSGGDWVDVASPLSPMKRSKQTHAEKDRGRDREPKPRKTSGHTVANGRTNGAWVRPRRDRDDSKREKRRDRDEDSNRRRRRSSSSASADEKPLKAIEYKPDRSASASAEPNNDKALVRQKGTVARQTNGNGTVSTASKSRVELFLGFVTKGPDSERGCSMNKALKRFHRERADNWDRGANWGGMSKAEEEKELFKNLRLKKNDRGEIVVFFDS